MSGITKDELMRMARETGLSFLDGSARAEIDDYIDQELIAFSNAILDRAAEKMEVQHTWITNVAASNLVRALKINTGD